MRKIGILISTFGLLCTSYMYADTYSLQQCRNLALENNRSLQNASDKQQIAEDMHKAAVTNFFPKISLYAGYMYSGKEISILNDEQKDKLQNLGTNAGSSLQSAIQGLAIANPGLMQMEILPGKKFQELVVELSNPKLFNQLDIFGSSLVDATETDTHHMGGAVLNLTQPIFAGGKIVAYNKITKINEQLTQTQYDTQLQEILYTTDNIYWQVVSINKKKQLAEAYLKLLQELSANVDKMISQGVATKSDALTVMVKMNEAEMNVSKAENGLALSKMLLCQHCGLPLDTEITLEDEEKDSIQLTEVSVQGDPKDAIQNRPEIASLELYNDIQRQKVNIVRSDYLPTIGLMANFMCTNPNIYNGFQNTFSGNWNVGVTLKMYLCHWGEGIYKVRAAKKEAQIAENELSDVREKITLQATQSSYKLKEAGKRLEMAIKNNEKAEENLRFATLSFKEGIVSSTSVLEAHTAWLSAQTEMIDAQVEMSIAESNYKKSMGLLK